MEGNYQKDCIFLFDHIFTNKECKYMINIINKYGKVDNEVYEKERNVIADGLNMSQLPDIPEKKQIFDMVFGKILNLCKMFKDEHGIKMGGFDIPGLRKIKGPTKYHKDGAVLGKYVHEGKVDATKIRNMSIIAAFNDNYKGGELCFPEQGRTIKLKRGQVIAFPPYWTHPHYSNELKDNTFRYTLTTWTYERL